MQYVSAVNHPGWSGPLSGVDAWVLPRAWSAARVFAPDERLLWNQREDVFDDSACVPVMFVAWSARGLYRCVVAPVREDGTRGADIEVCVSDLLPTSGRHASAAYRAAVRLVQASPERLVNLPDRAITSELVAVAYTARPSTEPLDEMFDIAAVAHRRGGLEPWALLAALSRDPWILPQIAEADSAWFEGVCADPAGAKIFSAAVSGLPRDGFDERAAVPLCELLTRLACNADAPVQALRAFAANAPQSCLNALPSVLNALAKCGANEEFVKYFGDSVLDGVWAGSARIASRWTPEHLGREIERMVAYTEEPRHRVILLESFATCVWKHEGDSFPSEASAQETADPVGPSMG